MKKNSFIKSTIILIIGGFITKILGMLIKIVTTRYIGTEGIGLYMMITPTFMILLSIAQLGFPVAISKLVAENKYNNKNLVFGIIPVSLFINILVFIFLFYFKDFISINLLHEKRVSLAILCIGFVLPFVSISSILRGYFFGKEKMVPHVLSNIVEDIVKLIAIIIGIPIFLNQGLVYAVAYLILSSIFSELASIITLFLFLPKNFHMTKNDFLPKKKNIKSILNIGIPTTGSRFIGSIGYFFEPIILSYTLLKCGYSNNFIITEYGILSGYTMPLLLLPSFFTLAISQALIPVISKSYSNGNLKYTKSKLKQAIFFSLLIGIPCTILFELFPDIFLKLIYNTNEGITYLRVLAPIYLFHYIQSPLTSTLQAMGKAKKAMNGTLIGMFIRTISLFVFSSLNIGMWGLVIASSLNIIIVTFHQMRVIKKFI